MTPIQEIRFIRGDTHRFEFVFPLNGESHRLSDGDIIRLFVFKGKQAILAKRLTAADQADNGLITVVFAPEDTSHLRGGIYEYERELITEDGTVATIPRMPFVLCEDRITPENREEDITVSGEPEARLAASIVLYDKKNSGLDAKNLQEAVDALDDNIKNLVIPEQIDDHTKLRNRDAADQHPITAITNLPDNLADLKGAVNSTGDEPYKLPISREFEVGSLNSYGVNESKANRVRTKEIINIGSDANLTIAEGFRIFVFFFDAADVFIKNSGGWISGKYGISAGSRIRMVIAKIDETNAGTPNIDEFVSAVTTPVPLVKSINELRTGLLNGFDASLNDIFLWEQGTYSAGGGLSQNAKRIRHKWPVHLLPGARVDIRPNGQQIAANILKRVAETGDFSTDFEYVKTAFSWQTEAFTFVSTDDVWAHFVVANKGDVGAITPSQLDVEIDLYDTYAGREITRLNIERLNYGENCVKTVAHRGDVTDAPENTLAAYRKAVSNGYKYMETDVHFTADGVPVMIHDDTIDRTSNGSGNVSDFTLSELKNLDFGSWKSGKYAGEKIPTFEEMLAFCRATGIVPFIELKDQTQAQVEMLVELVERYGLVDSVHWISFSATALGYVAALRADANLCLVHSNVSDAVGAAMAAYKTEKNKVGILCYQNSTEAAAEICRTNGLYMMGGVVNSEAAVLALPMYASWVMSDGVNATQVLYKNAMEG